MATSVVTLSLLVGCLATIFPFSQGDTCPAAVYRTRTNLTLEDNGYVNMMVAFHSDVPQDFSLIDVVKDRITELSEVMFTATKRRAYIANVTILVPATWDLPPGAEQSLGFQSYLSADMQVTPVGSEEWDWRPSLRQSKDCGLPAEHAIQIPLEYLENEACARQQFGEVGKNLVNLFARYRWGVFDEHPRDNFNHFRVGPDGEEFVPNICNERIIGQEVTQDGGECDYQDKEAGRCFFIPDLENNTVRGSLMYDHRITSVMSFCEDEEGEEDKQHQRQADNFQNKQCASMSAWQIILCSRDFHDGNNPPIPEEEIVDTEPTFIIVREEPKNVAAVLDISGSMSGERLLKLQRTMIRFINDTIPYEYSLSLVEFSSSATITTPMTLIEDQDDRDFLISKLPSRAGGGTCIGCGIQRGIESVENVGSTVGHRLLVITDGQEGSNFPRVRDMFGEVLDKRLTVDSVLYAQGGAADDLGAMSDMTGGVTCFCPAGAGDDICLNDCFTRMMDGRLTNVTEQFVQIATLGKRMGSREVVQGSVHLDYTLGRRTIFEFVFSALSFVEVTVKLPDGAEIGQGHPWYEQNTTLNQITIRIPGIADIGVYEYTVTSTTTSSRDLSLTIRSRPRFYTEDPILIRPYLSSRELDYSEDMVAISAYCEVHKGEKGLVEVNVNAHIDGPTGQEVEVLELLDNGAGADLVSGDGIYSGYAFGFTSNGLYSVTFRANTNNTIPQLRTLSRQYDRCQPRHPKDVLTGKRPLDINIVPPDTRFDPMPDFSRALGGQSFELKGYTGSLPGIPPARIQDLATLDPIGAGVAQLEWTAVGADMDVGTADHYDLRVSDVRLDLIDHFDNATRIEQSDVIVGDLNAPQESGSRERFSIAYATGNATRPITIYFAVRAVDADDRKGAVSNIASSTIRVFRKDVRKHDVHSPPHPAGQDKVQQKENKEVKVKEANEILEHIHNE